MSEELNEYRVDRLEETVNELRQAIASIERGIAHLKPVIEMDSRVRSLEMESAKNRLVRNWAVAAIGALITSVAASIVK